MSSMPTPALHRVSGRQRGDPEEIGGGAGSSGPRSARGDPPPPDPKSGVGSAPADGLSYIFEVTKAEVDTQFRISERLDSKARGLFALTAAVFAAAQALALRPDVLNHLGGARDDIVLIAIVAGSLVGAALIATAVATFVRKDKSVESKPLFGWLNQVADGDSTTSETVAQRVVESYISLMHRRREANIRRARGLLVVQGLCGFAIAASIVELIVALNGLA